MTEKNSYTRTQRGWKKREREIFPSLPFSILIKKYKNDNNEKKVDGNEVQILCSMYSWRIGELSGNDGG